MNQKISDQTEVRIEKLNQLKEQGVNPYSNNFKPGHTIADITKQYSDYTKEQLTEVKEQFTIAGRIISVRDFGKSIFFHLKDRTGKLQGFIQKDTVGGVLLLTGQILNLQHRLQEMVTC